MFFIPIVAGWVLGATSAKLIDDQRQKRASAPPADSEPTPTKTNPLQAGIDAIQSFKKEKIDPYMETKYSKYVKEVSLEEEELSEEQKMAHQAFVKASLMLASTTFSAYFYPPLIFLHVPPMLYLAIPFYKQAYDDFFNKQKVTTTVVDAVLSVSSLSYTLVHPPILMISVAGSWFFTLTAKVVTGTKANTRKSLTNIFGQQPQFVWLLKDGIEVEVSFETIQVGDILVLDAGQMIPVDGTIYDGVASIDQHILTGESQPAEKGLGDPVFAGTVILSGKIYVQVEKTGEETAAAQIGHILIQTSDFTSSLQLRGQEIADDAALPTFVLATLSWPVLGTNKALAILYSGVGYNMRILGPMSVLNYLQLSARQGILIKDGRALEQIRKVDTIVFDKTGTLTLEQPHVGAIYPCNGYTEEPLLILAAAAEHRQTHPIARAIQQEAAERQLELPSISDAAYQVGYGIKVTLDEKLIRVGSNRFMGMEGITIPAEIKEIAKEGQQKGYSLVYVAIDDQLGGAIELQPTIRPEAKEVIDALRQLGLEMYIISGDNERPTRALAEELGIEHYFAETLPENKADLIAKLQEEGKFVCFVGDGINDAIALKKAQISVSLRGASTIAVDTAQIILMDQTLNQLETLFSLSQEFEDNMQTSLMSTVVPGVIIIGGAFLGVVNYAGSIGLFFAGLTAGLVNTMMPILTAPEALELELETN